MSCWQRKNIALVAVITGLLWTVATSGWAEDKKGGASTVAEGKKVSLEYTLTLEDKTKVDSNVGGEPLTFTHGAHEVIPGLEKQLVGLKVGDTKHIEVPPEEGYGQPMPERMQEVEKSKLPAEAQKVGVMLEGRSPEGHKMFARVAEIKEKTILLDLNHPLAGKKLFFDIKVLKVEEGGTAKVETGTAAPAPPTKPAKSK